MAAQHVAFQHIADVADSVISSKTTDLLAGCTSMHDLMVVTTPIRDVPYGVVFVRAPNTVMRKPPATGMVVIEHLSPTGHDDRIERPASEAVPLFWRFMIEKYGIHPVER